MRFSTLDASAIRRFGAVPRIRFFRKRRMPRERDIAK
jgi:hypothetical protein